VREIAVLDKMDVEYSEEMIVAELSKDSIEFLES
jgi:hypothetical protein